MTSPTFSARRHRLANVVSSLLIATALACAPHAKASTFISVNIAPPLLPVYEQPLIPGPGYLWTPGCWAWAPDIGDYYWVPGTWVRAPYTGALWTPGYWGWRERVYVFHSGYWGPHVGYYGGINYGYGYGGVGYVGGYWHRGEFYYNTAYNRWNGGGAGIRINIYNRRVVENVTINRVSFNGPGGINHMPTRDERRAEHERHTEAVAEQVQHREAAQHNQALRASVNHGAPPVGATQRAGDFAHANPATAAPAGKSGESAPGTKAARHVNGIGDLHGKHDASLHEHGKTSDHGGMAMTPASTGGHAHAENKIILQHHAHTHADVGHANRPGPMGPASHPHVERTRAPAPHPVMKQAVQNHPMPHRPQNEVPRGNGHPQGQPKDHDHHH